MKRKKIKIMDGNKIDFEIEIETLCAFLIVTLNRRNEEIKKLKRKYNEK